MPVLRNIGQLATCRRADGQDAIDTIADAALAWRDGEIAWIGREADIPPPFGSDETLDAGGRLVVPGLVDCHTHLAFGGWRANEFAMRLQGATYLEIAKAGGGILATVARTREASDDTLESHCEHHLRAMAALGVTTVECKSGYGLDTATELRLLEVYRRLRDRQPLRLVSTFLGAHTVPAEHRAHRSAYLAVLMEEMLPAVARAGLASFCDAFVEESAFSIEEARAIFERAASLGLRAKLHADQLSDGGGAALAADVRAISADHLEHVSPRGIARLAEAGVVAVSLPIASLYLRQPPLPARALIESGVAVAVATDFNPGSAPSYHLPFAMLLACTLQRMTPAEAVKGATRYAARAIGLEDRVGSIEPGKAADFALIDAPDVDHWLYHFRANACVGTWVGGRKL